MFGGNTTMRTYKKNLPDDVRKEFQLSRGIKVKVLNAKYYGKKKNKKNTESKKAA